MPVKTCSFHSSVKNLYGVGPKKVKLLEKLGVETIEDLFYFFPLRYEDRRGMLTLSQIHEEKTAAFCAKVISVNRVRAQNRNISLLKALLTDGTDTAEAIWFNCYGLENLLCPGQSLYLWSKAKRNGKVVQLTNPEIEVAGSGSSKIVGHIVPIYRLTLGLNQRWVQSLMDQALKYCDELMEFLPQELLEQNQWPSLSEALLQIHHPLDGDRWRKARQRLVYGEFLQLQVGLAQRRLGIEKIMSVPLVPQTDELQSRFLQGLGFDLTSAQKRVMGEIRQDLTQSHPMNRLLQGDVGSGKTAVAVWALLGAVSAGFQGALMAPTSVLASQHFNLLQRIVKPLGVNVGLLTSNLTVKERTCLVEKLRKGDIDLIVGTHALLQEDVTFHRLGLVVVDEQHRFGVRQRLTLMQSTGNFAPHRLVMTATPIPRTLALTLYGDLSVSVLDEKPAGRQKVKTCLIPEHKFPGLPAYLRQKMDEGRQVYWVCSLIEDNEQLDATPLEARFEFLKRMMPTYSIEFLHGRMKEAHKQEVMERFSKGQIQLLVSTTVIEVGVDVPNATVMVIENAERFGLSQLHQLRGRVGRGTEESWCFLLSSAKGDAGKRLNMFAKTDDGFEIANYDLLERGPGEFCGTGQHGMTDFKIGNLMKDGAVMVQAQNDARRLVSENKVGPELSRLVSRRYGDMLIIAEVG